MTAGPRSTRGPHAGVRALVLGFGGSSAKVRREREIRNSGERAVTLLGLKFDWKSAAVLAVALAVAACGEEPSSSTAAPVPAMTVAAQIDPANVWDLSDLYATAEAWTQAHDSAKAAAERLETHKGTLGRGAGAMAAALDAISGVQKEALRLLVYAVLKGDEDVRIAENQERRQLAGALLTTIGERTAWLAPEILAVGETKVRAFRAEEEGLRGRHGFFLDNTLRAAPHTLSTESEGVIAATGNVLQQPNNVYDQLANGELPFPTITLADGSEVKLTQAAYSKYRQAPDRADRKKVFDAFWGAWQQYKGTMGAMLTTQIMGDVFQARVRKFPNALAASLFPDNMPEAVYRTLVSEANAGLPTLHRYFRLRKRLLGITGDMGYQDIYPPMFTLDREPKISVDDAKRITVEALQPFGDVYLGHLKGGFAGRWMHVYPQDGKANGAYMFGSAYDVHPYLLLNHNEDYDSLSTFAHEWGHAVHTMLTKENQPFEKSNYATFIAESASIINEMLLQEYMVANAKDDNEKLYYLGEALEGARGTFYRQTMFAEFELAIHEEIEAGRALSGERMTEMYCDLLKRYHGDAEGVLKIDPTYCAEWAYIPHFYRNFYVYQYATSMAGAALFTKAILDEGARARERFLAMLRAGGSDYPYEIYKRAGIDMATPEPYRALIARMDAIMDRIEALQPKP